MTMLTSYTGMEAGTSQIHISQLADFRISGVFLTPCVPENSPKPYKFDLEKAISALPIECQYDPCENVGHFLAITALSISKTSHLLFVTQTVVTQL